MTRNLERRIRELEAQTAPREESLFEAVRRARLECNRRQQTGEPIPERPLVKPGPNASALAVAVYEARLRAASRQERLSNGDPTVIERGSTCEATVKYHLQDTAESTSTEQVPR